MLFYVILCDFIYFFIFYFIYFILFFVFYLILSYFMLFDVIILFHLIILVFKIEIFAKFSKMYEDKIKDDVAKGILKPEQNRQPNENEGKQEKETDSKKKGI
jgi:hypothetical protein